MELFTGLIRQQGIIKRIIRKGHIRVIQVQCSELSKQVEIGDSISVNGACLTVTKIKADILWFELSQDTWQKTSFQFYKPNQLVNLEESLKAKDKIGGHFVTGHIDDQGKVISLARRGNELHLRIKAEESIISELIPNGSVAIDGISLTVKEVGSNWFSLIIIPYTIEKTTLGQIKVGKTVNIETDILGKYALAKEKQLLNKAQ